MTDCSICLLPIDEKEKISLDCSIGEKESLHCYHRGCILEWSKQSKHCPLCREPMKITHIFLKIEDPSHDYSISQNKKITKTTNKILNNKILAWIRIPLTFENKQKKIMALPLYGGSRIPELFGSNYISMYLRLYLLSNIVIYSKFIELKKDISNASYFDTDILLLGNIDKEVILNSYYYLYSLMFNLKKMYDTDYTSAMNTMIYDLTILSLNHYNIEDKTYFNQILGISIYNTLDCLSENKLSLEEVQNFMDIDYHPTINQVTIINYQKSFIKEYLTVN